MAVDEPQLTDEEWHERINEISELCNTTIVTDQMTLDEVIDLFNTTLAKIDRLAGYPPNRKL